MEFKIVNDKIFKSLKCRWYGAGNEIKIGDKIIPGLTLNYANLYGMPSTKVKRNDLNNVSLALHLFVFDEETNMAYQLYSIEE